MKKALFDGARSAPAAVAGPEAQVVAKVSRGRPLFCSLQMRQR